MYQYSIFKVFRFFKVNHGNYETETGLSLGKTPLELALADPFCIPFLYFHILHVQF